MVSVRAMTAEDWPRVEAILGEGIAEGEATFESTVPSWQQFDAGKIAHPRFVAELDGRVVGWVAASRVSAREVYRGVIEHSVYVDSRARGRGIGAALLRAFLNAADEAGFWTVQSSIFPRTSRACGCTSGPDSASSAPASGSHSRRTARTPASGGRRCSSSVGHPRTASEDRQRIDFRLWVRGRMTRG